MTRRKKKRSSIRNKIKKERGVDEKEGDKENSEDSEKVTLSLKHQRRNYKGGDMLADQSDHKQNGPAPVGKETWWW